MLVRPACTTLALAIALVGCSTFRSQTQPTDRPDAVQRASATMIAPAALPGKNTLRSPQYYFYADFELKPDNPLFVELGELREQIVRELHLPPANTVIQVYLFEDRDRYDKFMKARYPDLPKRRAFFVAQPRTVGGGDELLVYTFWGDRVRQDLRHELTHALLHSVLKDVPLWLDEGLAEFFESPPGTDGVNPQHVEQLRKGPFAPDLARLEQMNQVAQMTPAEYREAWAWTHLMLRGSPAAKAVLLAYLQQCRTNANPGPIQSKLTAALPGLTDALEMHLGQLARTQSAKKN